MENDEERREKLRQRIKKISEKAKDYLPEISGAAVGAAFGNPVVGAVGGGLAKKLLASFMKAKKKQLAFGEAIKDRRNHNNESDLRDAFFFFLYGLNGVLHLLDIQREITLHYSCLS